jgi:phenylacetate-coenzyme A ligase PaaK-like adenylate-forming protein
MLQKFLDLTEHHIAACPEYAKMMNAIHFDAAKVKSCADIPFLPVSLFKELDLRSITADEVFKTMTSSGTTGQAVSKIYLDKNTASNQQRALVKIVSDSIGASRLPMLIIDCPSVLKDRAKFSARGAGILGFSIFGADKTYALDDDMKLDLPAVEAFLAKHSGKRILLFGFTFMIWQHFYKELLKQNINLDFSNAVLIHGGGWKKLVSEAVSKAEFRERLNHVCGLRDIHDYYGMVEQTGSIFTECTFGHLHTNEFNDIFVRRAVDFSPCNFGERGIIQVMSVLPESYPGHSLLTEDEGVILGENDCPCKKPGKYFEVFGRLRNAEIRGCSDTYAERFN